jgi:hypothetical protein
MNMGIVFSVKKINVYVGMTDNISLEFLEE